jgi:hypothetical protein
MSLPSASKRACPMDEHERFVKFYDFIPEIFRSYVANITWTVGLLILVNGWILSSESTRAFIQGNKPAYLALILAVVITGVLHTTSCLLFYRRSREKINQLTTEYKDLHPLPFREYEIRKSILIINFILSWSLIISLIILATAAYASAHPSLP